MIRKFTTLLVGVACLGGALLFFAQRRAAATASAPQCKLTLPHSDIDPIVFPTQAGAESLDAAIMGNLDGDAMSRLMSEQGGARIAHGTACAQVEAGPLYSRVLVVGGPFDGKLVWAPTLHTQGL
jgi:hypothetical protein